MNEEDLEVMITMDDPGEDALEEDTFHQADNPGAHLPGESQQRGEPTGKQN
jgi:hypothetical protein